MRITKPALLPENSRSVLMTAIGQAPPNNVPQFVAAFISTLSAVSMGMVFTWTSSALPKLESEVGITSAQGAWIGSLVTLGAFVGAIPAGTLTHLLGRKTALLLLALPLIISWILISLFYYTIVIVYFARFIAGLAAGAISVAAPMYVAEMAHVSIRGSLGTFFQVQITIGILLEYLLGFMDTVITTHALKACVLPVAFIVMFAFVPESPVYYCEKGDMEQARKSLVWFRGSAYNVEDELSVIKLSIEEAEKNKIKPSSLINCKATVRGLIISFGLMTFQQLSGVNAVLFYANNIFQQSGGSLSPSASSILVGVVQVIATLGSTFLIELAGRKILLFISDFVMCISLAAIGIFFLLSETMDLSAYSFVPLAGVASFIISFSIGFGPIPWMIMGEIFPSKIKGIASSISASLNWFLAFMVTNQFSNMVNFLGIGRTFILFSLISGIGTVFVTLLVPETKGKSIDEVTDLLSGKKEGQIHISEDESDRMTTNV